MTLQTSAQVTMIENAAHFLITEQGGHDADEFARRFPLAPEDRDAAYELAQEYDRGETTFKVFPGRGVSFYNVPKAEKETQCR